MAYVYFHSRLYQEGIEVRMNEKVIRSEWVPELLGTDSKEKRLAAIDDEVERFSKWMSKLDDPRARGALNNPERALLRTYLVQKMNGKLEEVD